MSAGWGPADPSAKNIWCDAKDHARPRKYLEQNIFSNRGVQVELEQARPLTAPARRLLAPPQVALLLPLGDVGQNRPQPFVLHHRRLVHSLTLVEGPIRKLQPLVLDRKPTVGIVEHRDALAGEGPRDCVRLEDEQHVVILQRQAVGDRALLLPGESLVEMVVFA